MAHQGLPVGFLLLRYSDLFTVESLSLLYLLVISCYRPMRWEMVSTDNPEIACVLPW